MTAVVSRPILVVTLALGEWIERRGRGPRVDQFTSYWHNPGAFAHGFQGFCSVFVTAAFAYSGTELAGLAAAEAEDPVKTLPKATKQVFWRIFFFYGKLLVFSPWTTGKADS
jgi:amino acid permease